MVVKDVLPMIGKTIVSAAKKVGEAILNADAVALGKFGIVVGVAAATVALVFKFIKDKKKAFTDEEGKSPVDKSLELNYQDARNQDKLHPMMKKVRKQLMKDIRPKRKNGKKYKRDIILELSRKKAYRKGRRYSDDMYYDGPTQEEIDAVDAEVRDFVRNSDLYMDTQPNYDDVGCCRRVWNGTRSCW